MLLLIAQKKRLGALNALQKTTSLCQVRLLRKSDFQNLEKTPKCPKNGHFLGKLAFLKVFLDFLKTGSGKDLWIFALRSVPQDASFELSKPTFRQTF